VADDKDGQLPRKLVSDLDKLQKAAGRVRLRRCYFFPDQSQRINSELLEIFSNIVSALAKPLQEQLVCLEQARTDLLDFVVRENHEVVADLFRKVSQKMFPLAGYPRLRKLFFFQEPPDTQRLKLQEMHEHLLQADQLSKNSDRLEGIYSHLEKAWELGESLDSNIHDQLKSRSFHIVLGLTLTSLGSVLAVIYAPEGAVSAIVDAVMKALRIK